MTYENIFNDASENLVRDKTYKIRTVSKININGYTYNNTRENGKLSSIRWKFK